MQTTEMRIDKIWWARHSIQICHIIQNKAVSAKNVFGFQLLFTHCSR